MWTDHDALDPQGPHAVLRFPAAAVERDQGFKSKFQLYTVPGQPIYNDTRRIVLGGVDGVVFVADSQWDKMESNVESRANLIENLATHDLKLESLPLVLQFNKRDLREIAPTHYMNFLLNRGSEAVPTCESVASEGKGVFTALNAIAKLVMARFMAEHNVPTSEEAAPKGG